MLFSALAGLLVLLSTSCSDGWVDCSELQRQSTEIENRLNSGSIPWPSDEYARELHEQIEIGRKASEQNCSIYKE